MNMTQRLMSEAKMAADREVKFDLLEKLAVIHMVLDSVTEFEAKLITDLDVD